MDDSRNSVTAGACGELDMIKAQSPEPHLTHLSGREAPPARPGTPTATPHRPHRFPALAGAALGCVLALAVLATPALAQAPAAVSDVAVVPVPRSTSSLTVSWSAPDNAGKPAITGYDVRYRDDINWTTVRQGDAANTSLIITGLRQNAYYDVQVLALNADGSGPWSSTAEGATSPRSETLFANNPLIPDDLEAGDSFRLLHITEDTTTATDTGIHDYHNFPVAGLHAITDPGRFMSAWGGVTLGQSALVSTPGADARQITDTTWTPTDRGVPIYWLNGARVADDYADFYDGTWADEANPTNDVGEPHSLADPVPWTGTDHDGTELFDGAASRAVGQSTVGVGAPGSTASGAGPLNGDAAFASTEERPLYALWHVLVVGENLRLVTNINQPGTTSSDSREAVRAQLFTTGPHSSGYGIALIEVDRGSETDDFLGTVALHTTDTDGDPDLADGLHATLSLERTHAYTWEITAPAGTVLKPSTTYALVFKGDSSTYPELWTTPADGEDTPADGWSLADALVYYNGSAWEENSNGRSLITQIIGPALETDGPALVSATVGAAGNAVALAFDEDLALPSDSAEALTFLAGLASAFAVTADSAGVAVSGLTASGTDGLTLGLSGVILQGQAVALTYTDPTAGDDAVALQDGLGNETPTFTTGAGDVPAVNNNSALTNEVLPSWGLTPTGLAVGAKFRLLFLSSTKRDALSSDIADYNTFVQDRAAAGHADIQAYSWGFGAIGCTAAVDARDNTSTTGAGVPIYWLDGTKVADDYADFYDGSWDDEINDKNESGADAHDTSQEDNYPITGCMDDGTESFAGAPRPRSLGAPLGLVRIGRLNASGSVQDPIDGNDVADTDATRPMYGLSAVLEVAGAANTPALGAPTITGTPTVGQTLTAVTSAIMDANGLNNVSYTYQWIRVATDNTETNIDMATANTYTLVTADLGTTIKVKVSFTDDASNAETLTSVATAVVTADTTSPMLVSATVTSLGLGTIVEMDFDERLKRPSGGQFPAAVVSLITVTVDGVEVDLSARASTDGISVTLQLQAGAKIRSGQTVVIAYFDDTSGNDPLVFEDNAGNDVATFTTGMNGVPPVTNNSTVAPVAPGAPTGLTATANGSAQIDLSWTAPADNGGRVITGYKIEVSSDAGNAWTTHLADTTSADTHYEHTGLAASTTRDYRVSAINTIGTSPASNVDDATTGAGTNNTAVPNNWSLKPTGLAVGYQFRLLFLSSTKRNAQATDIAVYNTFIQTLAAAGHTDIRDYSAGFRVVGCTADTDARDNTSTNYTGTGTAKGVPIYWLGGAKAADKYADFYDGSWDDEANDKNESGTNSHDTSMALNYPWTGCGHDGTEAVVGSASFALGTSENIGSGVGRPNSSAAVNGPLGSDDNAVNTSTRPMYGLSAVFQVTTAVVNSPATGAPTITGTAQVGETLTAGTTAIMDTNGLTTPGYTYQWIRVATDTTETNISSATASTYTLVTDDLGTTIKVKVSFTDDASNAETRTSVATAAVSAAPDTTPPTVTGTPSTAASGTQIQIPFNEALLQSNGPLASAFTVTADGSAVRVSAVNLDPSFVAFVGLTVSPLIRQGQAVVVTYTDPSGGNDTNAIQDAAGNDAATFTTGMNSVPAVDNDSTVAPVAPGAPTGLTATASGSTQIDLSWTAPADNGGRVITGYKIEISSDAGNAWTTHLADTTSTNTTYEHTGLAASITRHYRVSAINTIGTSTASNVDDATTGAGTNNAPTASNGEVTATEDTDYPFTAPNFNFSDTDAGAALSSVKVTSLPASGKGMLKVDGTVIASGALPKAVTKVDIDARKLTYSPPANANGDDYATFQFKVNDGTDDSANASTMTIDVTAVNDAATGKPGITGTAQVGQLLTAAVGTIADPDGLPNPFLTDASTSFQWVRVTSGTDDDISGETASTYTLATADEGKTIKVKVSFQDGGGGSEGPLTSVATAVVSAAANSLATGAPTITGTPQVGQTLTAGTTAIMDTDGLTTPGYTYQWIRVATDNTETNIASATASTYTLVTDDLGTTIKVKVSFTDDASNAETRTSVATAAVAAAPNTPPSASNGTVTTNEDTPHTFTASEFSFSDTDGDTLSNVRIVTLPASGKGTLALSGTPVTANQVVAATAIGDLAYTPPANANGAGYTSFTFKVSDGTAESVAYTMTIDVTAVNDAPTVATAIPNQTAPVGTAFNYAFPPNTFNDADSDTLTYTAMKADNAALPTWLSFTANTRTFSGTPQAADVGPLPVKVTASDGNGGSVSDEFDITVSAASNTPATGAPTITGTAQVGQTLTAVTTAIMDANGLNNVSYTYQWIRVDGGAETNIARATASTHTLAPADQGKTIKVTVRFTDDANNPETLTSVATAAVSAAGNTNPPTVLIRDLSVREDIGRAEVPVTLTWAAQVVLSVPWSTSELNAKSPDDYTDGQGSVTFAPGVTEATISIPIFDDAVPEAEPEFFAVTLETGEGYRLESNGRAGATVAILDNDGDGLLPSLATVGGTMLVLTYDALLDGSTTPIPEHFFVTYVPVNSAHVDIDVEQVSVSGSTVTLILAAAVPVGQTVTLAYVSGDAPLQDMEGNMAVSFTGWRVINTLGGGTEPPGGGTEPPGDGGWRWWRWWRWRWRRRWRRRWH